MHNVYIVMLDRRGRVVWTRSENVHGKQFADLAVEDDRELVEEYLARCVMKGESVEFPARWYCEGHGRGWTLTQLYPVEPGSLGDVAVMAVSSVLPANYQEFNHADIELLGLLANDQNIRDAAGTIARSESAIDSRIKTLKSKLGKHTLHGLVAAAIRGRLVPFSPPPFSTVELLKEVG